MTPHRAKQQCNCRDVQEALESGNINVCRTTAIRTTLKPYSRHGFGLVSRDFNAGPGTRVVATVGDLLELKIEQLGEIIRWVHSTVSGDREPVQPKPAGGSK